MTEVVSIKFKNRGKPYFFDPAGLELELGEHVLVDTAGGMKMGVVSRENHAVEDTAVVQPLRRVLRKATQMDLRTEDLICQREESAMKICREKIAEHKLDMKLVDDAGNRLPHDGKTPGRLMVKGPTIAGAYYGGEGGDVLDDEGFFDTGDVSTIDREGYMQITDRAKDVVKSGGEWISSIEIENIAMGHDAVANAAVVGVAHPKWDERPILLCQLKPGADASADDLKSFLDGKIAKWWMPDDVLFVAAIPLGPTGKIDKKAIRAGLEGYELPFEVTR